MICIAKIHNLGKPGNSNLCNSHACFEVKIPLNKNNDNAHIERWTKLWGSKLQHSHSY